MDVKAFVKYWSVKGVTLPNPDHYPNCFQWYVKLYKHQMKRNLTTQK